jgi:hypothetical protein
VGVAGSNPVVRSTRPIPQLDRSIRARPTFGHAPRPGGMGVEMRGTNRSQPISGGDRMPEWAWFVIVLVVIAVIALAAWAAMRKRRTQELQRQFGSEYDRVVGERGDRADAEEELVGRRERRESLDIRPLEPETRRRYAERWEATQAKFVDSPQLAITEADVLVQSVMRDRGYPVEDTDDRMAVVSVDHPEVMGHFRLATRVAVAARQERASTEDLRQAMVHYRSLFETLLGDEGYRQTA